VYRIEKQAVVSLLLGLYAEQGELANVGVVGAFPMEKRRRLFKELNPLVTTFYKHTRDWAKLEAGARTPRSAETSRWSAGKDLSFVPLLPERVIEVRYDHMEGPRFRHTTQFVRWRIDRDPRSCTFAQLQEPVRFDLVDILGS
jgi:ATP-dependent DNA ligase